MAPKKLSSKSKDVDVGASVAAPSAADLDPISTNERILQRVQQIYQKDGLTRFSETLGVPCQIPRKTVTVMIIGNHSAGKSSFVNWYTGQSVQSVGVAIETQGFTFITPGKKRETLRGEATERLFPQVRKIADMPGVRAALTTEIIVPGDRPNSHLITFLDTPGLVDGLIGYTYDVEEVMVALAQLADVILIFHDPIGQALCARTMRIVKRLNEMAPAKLHFFLSKADTVPNESDRQKVLIQITQNLSQHLGNRTFNLPTIYIPVEQAPVMSGPAAAAAKEKTAVVNHIEELCEDLDNAVHETVQSVLAGLQRDCETGITACKSQIEQAKLTAALNRKRLLYRALMKSACVLLALLVTFSTVVLALELLWPSAVASASVAVRRVPVARVVWNVLMYCAEWVSSTVMITAMVMIPSLWFMSNFIFAKRPVLTKTQIAERLQGLQLLNACQEEKEKLYDLFLRPLVDRRS